MTEEPKPWDAVLGGQNKEPKPKSGDAVLGWTHRRGEKRELTNEETLKLNFILDPKLEPEIAHALASLVSAASKYYCDCQLL